MSGLVAVEFPLELEPSSVVAACQISTGTVAFPARPEARREWSALRDTLTATGADLLALPPPKSMDNVEQIVISRLVVRGVNTVIVLLAENLMPGEIERLNHVATAANVQLVLAYGLDCVDSIRASVNSAGGTLVASWDSLALNLPECVPPAEDLTDESGFPAEIPAADFPLFRAACRDLLPADQFARVDQVYREVFTDVRALTSHSDDALADYLRHRLAATDYASEGIVVARALQAATLLAGALVKIDIRGLELLILEARHRTLTATEAERLWKISSPHTAVACVLTDAGLALRLEELTAADIHPGGIAHAVVTDPTGLDLLDVLNRFNALTGTPEDSPLFQAGNRRLTAIIEEAANALGLPLWPAMARDTRRGDFWRHQRGLTTVDLT